MKYFITLLLVTFLFSGCRKPDNSNGTIHGAFPGCFITSYTDNGGNPKKIIYDVHGQVDSVIDSSFGGYPTKWKTQFNFNGQLVKYYSLNGTEYYTFSWDANGQLASIISYTYNNFISSKQLITRSGNTITVKSYSNFNSLQFEETGIIDGKGDMTSLTAKDSSGTLLGSISIQYDDKLNPFANKKYIMLSLSPFNSTNNYTKVSITDNTSGNQAINYQYKYNMNGYPVQIKSDRDPDQLFTYSCN